MTNYSALTLNLLWPYICSDPAFALTLRLLWHGACADPVATLYLLWPWICSDPAFALTLRLLSPCVCSHPTFALTLLQYALSLTLPPIAFTCTRVPWISTDRRWPPTNSTPLTCADLRQTLPTADPALYVNIYIYICKFACPSGCSRVVWPCSRMLWPCSNLALECSGRQICICVYLMPGIYIYIYIQSRCAPEDSGPPRGQGWKQKATVLSLSGQHRVFFIFFFIHSCVLTDWYEFVRNSYLKKVILHVM